MSDAMINVNQLSLQRDGKPVLTDISTTVHAGDIIGVLGKNGAGKTTLLETLLGFHAPTAGSVQVFGCAARAMRDTEKLRIGFVPQQDELLDGLTGDEQVRLIASFYPRWDHALLQRLREQWQLPLQQRIRTLSGGQRQKLSIVLALCAQPDLLVLDEPVASLDPLARQQFLDEMLQHASRPNRAVVFSSHLIADLDGLINQVWIIDNGRLRWQGPVADAHLAVNGVAPLTLAAVFQRLLQA